MSNPVFIVPGSIAALLLIGLFLRNKIPLLQKILLPASILAGLIGFLCMNFKIIPVDQSVYEEVSFHLINLSFISITLSSVKKEKTKKKDTSFFGGLWMTLLFGGLYSLQVLIGGITGLFTEKIGYDEFPPLLGTLNGSGFVQGSGQALSMGRIWEGAGLADAAQIGLFYAAAGYLAATLVGIPICNAILKKRRSGAGQGNMNPAVSFGIYKKEAPSSGKQTTHRSNLDSLTTHIALLFVCYFITYILVSLVCSFLSNPTLANGIYNMMFIWGVLVSNLFKVLLRTFHCDYLIDPDTQTSITNFLTDILIVSCMMSISIALIQKHLVPLLLVSALTVFVTAVVSYFFAKQTGPFFEERFVAIFGICTGTAVTGILLLRVIDPEYKTPIAKEIVWWNILQMGAGIILTLAATAPAMGFAIWMALNVAGTAGYCTLTFLTGKKLKKCEVLADEKKEATAKLV